MSSTGQRPEHLLIREYIHALQASKTITQEGLRDAFVAVYVEMVPPGEGVPEFEQVHRLDAIDDARRKDDANKKKLWRAIEGKTIFPLVFSAPLIAALDRIQSGLGIELQKVLMHNAGLYYMPIDNSGKAPSIYAELLKEFAEFNEAIVADMADDGILNSKNTREQLLDSIEKHFAALRELDKNIEKGQ